MLIFRRGRRWLETRRRLKGCRTRCGYGPRDLTFLALGHLGQLPRSLVLSVLEGFELLEPSEVDGGGKN